MLIFNYPTPNIARQQLAEFEKLSGAVAKRSGPMVAVVLSPSTPITPKICSRRFGIRLR